jgi:hypothetical protein
MLSTVIFDMLQSYRLLLAELFMIIFLIEKLFNLWVSTFLVRFPLCTMVSFANKTDRQNITGIILK